MQVKLWFTSLEGDDDLDEESAHGHPFRLATQCSPEVIVDVDSDDSDDSESEEDDFSKYV